MDDNLCVEIDLVKYVSCRKNEIDLLKSESFLTKEDKQKSLFQLLPRHMRRRTMGYLRKRLPRRIRNQATIKTPLKVTKPEHQCEIPLHCGRLLAALGVREL
jgi:hypothetical protein